jgi:hypothetical protein
MTLTAVLPRGVAHGATSAPVTDWGPRVLLTVAVVGACLVVLGLMWRAWQRKGSRQLDLPTVIDVREPRDLSGALLGPLPGRYLASTRAGDWLDRVVVHGLGVPSRASLTVLPQGVLIERQGADDVFIRQAALRGVRLDRAIAGSVFEDGGVVVISWQLGDALVDTGFRAQEYPRHDELVRSVQLLAAAPAAGDPPVGPGGAAGADGAAGPEGRVRS